MKFSISSRSLHKHNHDCGFEGLPLQDLVLEGIPIRLPMIKTEKDTGICPVSSLDNLSSRKTLGSCFGSCCHSCGMGFKARIYFAITDFKIHLAIEQATTGLWGCTTDKNNWWIWFCSVRQDLVGLRISCKHWFTSRQGSKKYLVNVTE